MGVQVPPRKYSVCVPGLGQDTADSVGGLCVDGAGLCALTKRAAAGWEQRRRAGAARAPRQPATVWLDILGPTADDIAALAGVFGIGGDALQRLLAGASSQVLDPECVADGRSLYLCWAEVAGTSASMSQYILHGSRIDAPGDAELLAEKQPAHHAAASGAAAADSARRAAWLGGYVPVHPWMQPSATQVYSRLETRRRGAGATGDDELAGSQAAATRQQQAARILELLDKPVVRNRERLRSALEHWGPVRERWWKQVLDSTQGDRSAAGPHTCCSKRARTAQLRQLAEQLSQGARETIGYRTVQLWVCGPVVLSLHRDPSEVVTAVAREMAQRAPRRAAAEPLAVVRRLVQHWVRTAASRLPVLDKWSDRLDHDLTHPVHIWSIEPSNWSPVVVRGRKASLALLRRCQVNESVLRHLCAAVRSPTPSPQLATLCRQRKRTAELRDMYKRAEQRLSRLHRILLDRQLLRVIKTQKAIHRYFRILVAVELAYLPMDLWHNLDKLNGITTPGRLQPDEANDEDFLLTVLGMAVWAVIAVLLYLIYAKYFEIRHSELRQTSLPGLGPETPRQMGRGEPPRW
ncbi:hypothetical protein IWQ57_001327 [Coemansia nantahalensis]|uniref:Uncharacterized protein n=1 Tax=Coemansia nantahalensis TaxID=2789366 RepID=A0ACC1K4Z4_9FUNG|nr:hypothetical protein IWQ57_001327 [Coemansia nantahalensis]